MKNLSMGSEILYILIAVWIAIYLIWERITKNEGKLKIYPLVVIYESSHLKEMIMKSGVKRRRFWLKMGSLSDRIFPLVMVLGIAYIFANFIAIIKQVLVIIGGLPVGSEFMVAIPILTIPIGKFLFLLILSFAPAVLLHEFFHGAVSIAEDVEVASAGFVFSLAIFGGYVEPKIDEIQGIDESGKKERNSDVSSEVVDSGGSASEEKQEKVVVSPRKYRHIVAVGIMANIILAILFFGGFYAMNRLDLCEEYGLEIVKIVPDSPADKYGLHVSDIIIRINETRIKTVDDLRNFMANTKPGDMIYIVVVRSQEILNITLILGEKNGRAYIGVELSQYYKSNIGWIPDELMFDIYFFTYLSFIVEFLIVVLNVLPCFILDGAQWLRVYILERNLKNGKAIYILINILVTTLLLLNFMGSLILDILH